MPGARRETGSLDRLNSCMHNSSAAAVLSVNLVTSFDNAGNQNLIVKTKTLLPSETYTFPELVGHVLRPGGFISTLAGTASAINIRVSGREVT